MVKLTRGGEPVKMSKRAGSFITLRDVVDEVGKDVTRFIMLFRKNDAPLDFDFEKVMEQSRDNPVFYVQYAHARICSVLRNAAEEVPGLALDSSSLAEADFGQLSQPEEQQLMQLIGQWPRLVEAAAVAHEPHRIAFFLNDLAASFHGWWNRGKEAPELRFILSDQLDVTGARLALLSAVRVVLASGLDVLGVTPVEEMR